MIIVHHLDDSRSQRILWLLDELGEHYEIEQHRRDPVTRAAPATLKQIHPLGKSPVKSTNSKAFAKGVERALKRAAAEARRIARLHGTPIYVWEKGKVVAKDS
jgi:glutathione S-transferase